MFILILKHLLKEDGMKTVTKLLCALSISLLAMLSLVGCDTNTRPITCPLAPPYCGGLFPLNNQNTTQYGPPWANVVTQFLPCFGPYALCYYADCTPGLNDTVTECECESLFGLNFVEMSSIMNKPVYEETIRVCAANPERCSIPNGAPVCDAINNQTFYQTVPNVVSISDFSFFGFDASAAIGTNCTSSPGIYAGCMTTACYDNNNGNGNLTCICPTFDGPFQLGQVGVPCDISPLTYSASYNPTSTTPKTPTVPSNINCFPDAGANAGNPVACPLYSSSTVLPPNSNVNCSEVCKEYNTCIGSSTPVQVGYTCDTTICTTEQKDIFIPACMGLQKCDISEIMKAEFAAGCSCCASQLCGCTPDQATNKEIYLLNQAQRNNGDTPQCDINGTLCGTP